jgi:hypothetical protein
MVLNKVKDKILETTCFQRHKKDFSDRVRDGNLGPTSGAKSEDAKGEGTAQDLTKIAVLTSAVCAQNLLLSIFSGDVVSMSFALNPHDDLLADDPHAVVRATNCMISTCKSIDQSVLLTSASVSARTALSQSV